MARGGAGPRAWIERELVSAALRLGARSVPGWSRAEESLARHAVAVPSGVIRRFREAIGSGEDPLGELLLRFRPPEVRRNRGATYTPPAIVRAMLAWAEEQEPPERVVDPGAGSARFLLAAASAFPRARLLGVEIDPLAALIARANLAVAGVAHRSRILLGDYRGARVRSEQRTLFIGNPPYVRHHLIEPSWKAWLAARARELGLQASGLAGLHVHFFLATLCHANPGDSGALVTAAEWLDVNYGELVRALFLGRLGGRAIVVVEPTVAPFPDAATTAAITLFKIGSRPGSIRLKRVGRLCELRSPGGGRLVGRSRLESETRWSRLTFAARRRRPGFVELGELCRVHRGQVTGANDVWIAGDHAAALPERVLLPSVTRARELIAAGGVLEDSARLRCVVDLPEDLDELSSAERRAVEAFLRLARERGAHRGYIACHRRAWWSVGLRAAAPILATYMARRPPAFVRNLASARHLNIAHGLYPREPLTEAQLRALVDHLSSGVSVRDGRTYSGGLTKFEPGEMQRLLVPGPALLAYRFPKSFSSCARAWSTSAVFGGV